MSTQAEQRVWVWYCEQDDRPVLVSNSSSEEFDTAACPTCGGELRKRTYSLSSDWVIEGFADRVHLLAQAITDQMRQIDERPSQGLIERELSERCEQLQGLRDGAHMLANSLIDQLSEVGLVGKPQLQTVKQLESVGIGIRGVIRSLQQRQWTEAAERLEQVHFWVYELYAQLLAASEQQQALAEPASHSVSQGMHWEVTREGLINVNGRPATRPEIAQRMMRLGRRKIEDDRAMMIAHQAIDLAQRSIEQQRRSALKDQLNEALGALSEALDREEESSAEQIQKLKERDDVRRQVIADEQNRLRDADAAAQFIISYFAAAEQPVYQGEVAHLLGTRAEEHTILEDDSPRSYPWMSEAVDNNPKRVSLVARMIARLRNTMTERGMLMWFDNPRDDLSGKSVLATIEHASTSDEHLLRQAARF